MARDKATDGMRRYWDERAQENAAYYVDTTCSYDAPDMDKFFEAGRAVVDAALVSAPFQPSNRGVAVEIGSGLGRVCLALSEQFERVIGLDISREMVERARTLVADPRITFEVGDGSTLAPLEDDSADFVTTFTVFQHLVDRPAVEGYLLEAGRVLRKGGVLAAQWNNEAHPWKYKARNLWWLTRKRLRFGFADDERAAPQFLGTTVSVRHIRAALQRAGLTVLGTAGEGTLFAWVWAEKQ